jgi:hypothetical protein
MHQCEEYGLAAVVGFVVDDVVKEPAESEPLIVAKAKLFNVGEGAEDLAGLGPDGVLLLEVPGERLLGRTRPLHLVLARLF